MSSMRIIRPTVSLLAIFGFDGACGFSLSPPTNSIETDKALRSAPELKSPLCCNSEELSNVLNGKGRAQNCWDALRLGVDPVWYYSSLDQDSLESEYTESLGLKSWSRQEIQDSMSAVSVTNPLGKDTINLLNENFASIEGEIAQLSKLSIAPDGTTKMLIKLLRDGLEVESVIIPWDDQGKSTLCISSQVGCRQACTFCATGRMGKYRNLSTSEILAQMHLGIKVCRLNDVFPINNVVFMGQGEPADNAESVVEAAKILADRDLYQLSPRRVTISTVAPEPECFSKIGEAGVALAWSVHASKQELREELVPTTRHSMNDLREGLITTLQGRTKRQRNTMLEVALIGGVNDSKEDALHLVEFCQPFFEEVKGMKLFVNLIPWNDIGATHGPASTYKKPDMERVIQYQDVLREHGILCYIRTTRGDEENAACGMLTTKKKKSERETV
mmetsp:Transcript_12616/g.30129  ORF Transcript_12616/g.30129 Transcript_12616/m.30129 type:complete len:446 (+) Transcript_12616:136-1473(+)|eukprot:CAMPEP_0113634802 /NCGR_PEP_ID=MMETSP0017_2-20120614/18130_1 /TAXON_ID=2856 /ORGANISM="Cylindrotheca closterium" /LENGTH=445 /DNA_ID=CAMNT_0000545533 /DNA_START=58 /DNA_END=1395 /DNA_ORIENTATION=- /assembly_acc=CAM_ASM_000147